MIFGFAKLKKKISGKLLLPLINLFLFFNNLKISSSATYQPIHFLFLKTNQNPVSVMLQSIHQLWLRKSKRR